MKTTILEEIEKLAGETDLMGQYVEELNSWDVSEAQLYRAGRSMRRIARDLEGTLWEINLLLPEESIDVEKATKAQAKLREGAPADWEY